MFFVLVLKTRLCTVIGDLTRMWGKKLVTISVDEVTGIQDIWLAEFYIL